MVETLHPDVFVQERAGTPSITGVSTSTLGLVGTARRGFTDRLTLVTSFTEFVTRFGEGFADSFLEDAVFAFFNNGGGRVLVSRAVGSGALKAISNAGALGGAASAAQIDGTGTEAFDLEPADAISISVDSGGAQTFTFTATRGTLAAGGAAVPTPGAADTLVVNFNGTGLQIVTFAGTEATADAIALAINSQTTGGRCINTAGTLTLESDLRGTGSSVAVDVSSTAGGLAATAFVVGSGSGTGNVANIDAVTLAEALALLSTLTGATASANAGKVRLTHDTAGVASTIEVTAAATPFGFPAGVVAGLASVPVNLFTVEARTEGAHGNTTSFTTERWRATTTEDLLTAGTQVQLTDVSKAEIGDVVRINDGTTSVIVHVRSVDIANRRILFNAVTLGATIATGAVANTASSHRSRTVLTAAAVTADTVINVQNASQMRVGTELSIDNGTSVVFREVSAVNGTEITLTAALGLAGAVDDPVVLQTFNLTTIVDGEVDQTHSFLSMIANDQTDWVEFRLNGTGNQSSFIQLVDLDPSIALDLEDRPDPVVSQLLTGGADGAVPLDNDYIGTAVPPTGLQLFNDLVPGEVNILAIPGITTLAVQTALSDFADLKANVIALIDPPLANDEPLEVRDWRQNQFNRDTSYAALYYPWLTIRDRNSTNRNARKDVPPSGHVAGIYALVDSEVGVWEAPGNRPLRGVLDVVFKVSDGAHDLLNPVGVNVIRSFPGEGIRIMGVRTLSNLTDGRQYVNVRRLLNFDKISISRALRQFIFKGIQPSLFSVIERIITAFHKRLWLEGGLFPNNDFSRAHFVKVDEDNNPLETRQQGQLFVDAGINPPIPAEFIIFRIGVFDGETNIEEIVGGA